MWWYLLILLIIVLFYYWEAIKIQLLLFIIVKRGLITIDCFWWKVSDLFVEDASGINLYYKLRKRHNQKMVPIYLGGNKTYLVTNLDNVRAILDASPAIFGVGRLKYNMFQSFMEKNVGVSEGCPWRLRRKINEQTLFSDKLHPYHSLYAQYISENFDEKLPTNFNEFSLAGKKIATRIIFNDNTIPLDIYNIFTKANTIFSIYGNGITLPHKFHKKYDNILKEQLRNPKENSLVSLAVNAKITGLGDICAKSVSYLDYEEELSQQIPHWMFPISGNIAAIVPKVLMLLCNHPEKLKRAKYDKGYLRNCILETLRLNNPVVTTLRGLLTDFTFPSGEFFRKGSQFLILNNPVLRTPEFFEHPNQFYPERWTKEMENNYHAIMFNQGPQRCPGKELAILIIGLTVSEYLNRVNYLSCQKLNTNKIKQMIDPCSIRFRYS